MALRHERVDLGGAPGWQVLVVHLRFFAGLSVEETAKALEVSERTVKREWAVARAWLYEALREAVG